MQATLETNGIVLVADRSGQNRQNAPLSYGAWIDHAGFFVTVDGQVLHEDGREMVGRFFVAGAGRRPGHGYDLVGYDGGSFPRNRRHPIMT